VVLAGDVGTLVALHDPRIAVGDQGEVATILAGDRFHPFAGTAAVDAYVNAHPHAVILADSFDSWAIILRAARPRQFVITSDIDFASVLANPRGRVTWILVPEPTGLSTLDAVNRQYPHLWAGGVAWTRLVRSFPGPSHDRLYAVLADAP
jgi:Leu/Phe-tRNA-protein transferase